MWLRPVVLVFTICFLIGLTGSPEVDDGKVGDVHVVCGLFAEGQESVCTCAVNKVEADSPKCSFSASGGALAITLTQRNGATLQLCDYYNYTTEGLPMTDPSAICSPPTVNTSVYTFKLSVTGNRSVHEGARVNCRPTCLDSSHRYGLINSFRGMPIAFNPCVPNPCHDGGCRESSFPENFTCYCDPGYAGVVCNERAPLEDPQFDNTPAIPWATVACILAVAVVVGTVLVIRRKNGAATNRGHRDSNTQDAGDHANTTAQLENEVSVPEVSSASLPASSTSL